MLNLSEVLDASEAFLTDYRGYRVVWSLLSVKQYEALRGLVSNGIILEGQARCEAFRLCAMNYGPVFDLWPAGIVDAIGSIILWYSGDCNTSTLKHDLNQLRSVFTGRTPHEHMVHVILTAFPQLTIDEVESWSRAKLLKTFVRSEHVLGYRIGEKFNYLDLNSIRFVGEEDSEHPDSVMIDIDKEIAAQQDAGIVQNPWAEEAESWHQRLTPEQLAQLDRRR